MADGVCDRIIRILTPEVVHGLDTIGLRIQIPPRYPTVFAMARNRIRGPGQGTMDLSVQLNPAVTTKKRSVIPFAFVDPKNRQGETDGLYRRVVCGLGRIDTLTDVEFEDLATPYIHKLGQKAIADKQRLEKELQGETRRERTRTNQEAVLEYMKRNSQTSPNCRQCGSETRVRLGKTYFWGCITYPGCRGRIQVPRRWYSSPKYQLRTI